MFRVQIRQPLLWLIGDKPEVSGKISHYDVEGQVPQDLLFATLSLTWPGNQGDLVRESLISVDSDGKFLFKSTAVITQQRAGKCVVEAAVNSGATALLNGAILANETTATIDGKNGSIPSSGWLIIDGEAIAYSYDGVSTLTLTERGSFQTTAAGHEDNTAITFAGNKYACIPLGTDYKVKDRRYLGTALT